MKRSKKASLKKIGTLPVLGMLVGLLVFVGLAIVYNDDLSAQDSNASYQQCIKVNSSSTLVSSYNVKVSIKVYKSGKSLVFSATPITANVVCSTTSTKITCGYKSNPKLLKFYASKQNNNFTDRICFTIN